MFMLPSHITYGRVHVALTIALGRDNVPRSIRPVLPLACRSVKLVLARGIEAIRAMALACAFGQDGAMVRATCTPILEASASLAL